MEHELDGSVGVIFLFDHRVIVDDISKTIAENVGEEHGNDGARRDETSDFFRFGDGPQDFVGARFRRGVCKGFAVSVQVER